uniref:Uncharacterized protein n=1 Tax=Anguilla anguilla TaxID=7936 RepID=A0A0E9WI85_ANGAN
MPCFLKLFAQFVSCKQLSKKRVENVVSIYSSSMNSIL